MVRTLARCVQTAIHCRKARMLTFLTQLSRVIENGAERLTSNECLGVAVHEGDGECERVLALRGLELQPAGRLVASPVHEGALQAFLAVRGVARRTLQQRENIQLKAFRQPLSHCTK